jgi:hypothetical protein
MWVFKFSLWGRIGQLHCPLMATREKPLSKWNSSHSLPTLVLSPSLSHSNFSSLCSSWWGESGSIRMEVDVWPNQGPISVFWPWRFFRRFFRRSITLNQLTVVQMDQTIFYWKLLRISCIMGTMKPCIENEELIPSFFLPILTHKLKNFPDSLEGEQLLHQFL